MVREGRVLYARRLGCSIFWQASVRRPTVTLRRVNAGTSFIGFFQIEVNTKMSPLPKGRTDESLGSDIDRAARVEKLYVYPADIIELRTMIS